MFAMSVLYSCVCVWIHQSIKTLRRAYWMSVVEKRSKARLDPLLLIFLTLIMDEHEKKKNLVVTCESEDVFVFFISCTIHVIFWSRFEVELNRNDQDSVSKFVTVAKKNFRC